MKYFFKIAILLLQLSTPSFASEDLTLEKEFQDSHQMTKIIAKTLKLKKQGRIKGQLTQDFLLPFALTGETVEKISIAYNVYNECKVIMKTKSYFIESAYPKKGKCMDLFPGL